MIAPNSLVRQKEGAQRKRRWKKGRTDRKNYLVCCHTALMTTSGYRNPCTCSRFDLLGFKGGRIDASGQRGKEVAVAANLLTQPCNIYIPNISRRFKMIGTTKWREPQKGNNLSRNFYRPSIIDASVCVSQWWGTKIQGISTRSSIFICFCKQKLWLGTINDVINFTQSQLLLAKTNEDRSRKQMKIELQVEMPYWLEGFSVISSPIKVNKLFPKY